MGGEQLFGALPEDWEYTSLGEACNRGGGNIQTGPFGSQLHASDYVAEGIPSVMPQNIGDNRIVSDGIARITPEDAERLSRYLLRFGDIVYSRRGNVERRALVRNLEDGWLCGTGCLRVRLGENGVNPRYASFYLAHPSVREWIVRHAHGATMANLNTSILSACPFVIPTVEDQRAIADILCTFDDKIELNRQMSRTQEAMVRAIFKAWFVDFEPVKAKAAGAKSFRGMPQAVFDQLPGRFTDTELGPVPEGWEIVRIDELMDVNPKRALRKGEKAPYLAMSEMPTRGHHPESWDMRNFGSGMRFQNGDTLVARITPCLENGKTAFVDFLQDDTVGWGSTEYIVLRPRPPLPEIYAYCLARSGAFRDFAIMNMTGTSGRQRVPPSAIAGFKCVRPPESLAKAFGSSADSMFAMIAENHKVMRTLAAIRDTLLPKLISGELRVPAAEKSQRRRPYEC